MQRRPTNDNTTAAGVVVEFPSRPKRPRRRPTSLSQKKPLNKKELTAQSKRLKIAAAYFSTSLRLDFLHGASVGANTRDSYQRLEADYRHMLRLYQTYLKQEGGAL
jgi:hypothetical protein